MGLLFWGGVCASAGIADETSNRASAVRPIDETPSILDWVAFLYRDFCTLRNARDSFADGRWHFVEVHRVVSAQSLGGIHGAGMISHRLFHSSVALVPLATPTFAQTATQPTPTTQPSATAQPAPDQSDNSAPDVTGDYGDEAPIVINGAKARGSVIGDIPPEDVLDSRDVRATGATNINELLQALAPQIGSAQGRGAGQPILLLNGQRISGFRELRDIPTEAIERVEILPEEVALKYGYSADQKVVNIVLRQRFRSTTAQAGAGVATDGGYVVGNTDLTRFL